MTYLTHTFIRNLVLTSLVGQYQKQLDYPVTIQTVYKEIEAGAEGTREGNDLIKNIVGKFDLDYYLLSSNNCEIRYAQLWIPLELCK